MKTRPQQMGDHDFEFQLAADSNWMISLVALIVIILGISLAVMFKYS